MLCCRSSSSSSPASWPACTERPGAAAEAPQNEPTPIHEQLPIARPRTSASPNCKILHGHHAPQDDLRRLYDRSRPVRPELCPGYLLAAILCPFQRAPSFTPVRWFSPDPLSDNKNRPAAAPPRAPLPPTAVSLSLLHALTRPIEPPLRPARRHDGLVPSALQAFCRLLCFLAAAFLTRFSPNSSGTVSCNQQTVPPREQPPSHRGRT